MSASRFGKAPPWVWLLVAFIVLCVLLILDPFAVELSGSLVLALYVFALTLLPLALAALAYLDARRVAREGPHTAWETIDVVWTIGFFVLPAIGPLLWFYGGRRVRARERSRPRVP